MGGNTINLNMNEKKFLNAILKHGNVTDTAICEETGLSKSTCSRIRRKLEGTLISEYIPIIELHKVGINVFLVLTFQWTAFNDAEITKKTFSEFEKDPHVVFLASGQGLTASTVIFMAFEDLETCNSYLKEFRKKYGEYTQQINTLLLPSKEVIKNDFTEVIRKVIGGNEIK